jgi:hypothetical protein
MMRLLHYSVDRRPEPFCSMFFPYIPLCSYLPSTTRAFSFSPSVWVGCFAYIIRDQSTVFKLILAPVSHFSLPNGILQVFTGGKWKAQDRVWMFRLYKRWFGE